MNKLIELLNAKGWEYDLNGNVLYIVIGNEEYEASNDIEANEIIEIVKGW